MLCPNYNQNILRLKKTVFDLGSKLHTYKNIMICFGFLNVFSSLIYFNIGLLLIFFQKWVN